MKPQGHQFTQAEREAFEVKFREHAEFMVSSGQFRGTVEQYLSFTGRTISPQVLKTKSRVCSACGNDFEQLVTQRHRQCEQCRPKTRRS